MPSAFHPEVTLEMKQIWTLAAAERLKMPGAQQRGVHLSMHPLYDPPLDRWIDGFLDRWLATQAAAVVGSAFRDAGDEGENARGNLLRIAREESAALFAAGGGAA